MRLKQKRSLVYRQPVRGINKIRIIGISIITFKPNRQRAQLRQAAKTAAA